MELIDASKMHQKHPDTFSIPDPEEVRKISPGDFIKVCFTAGERAWVLIRERSGDTFRGTVDNACLSAGVAYGDSIELEVRHAYDILEGSPHSKKLVSIS